MLPRLLWGLLLSSTRPNGWRIMSRPMHVFGGLYLLWIGSFCIVICHSRTVFIRIRWGWCEIDSMLQLPFSSIILFIVHQHVYWVWDWWCLGKNCESYIRCCLLLQKWLHDCSNASWNENKRTFVTRHTIDATLMKTMWMLSRFAFISYSFNIEWFMISSLTLLTTLITPHLNAVLLWELFISLCGPFFFDYQAKSLPS